MVSAALRPVTKDNWLQVTRLKPSPSQQDFVAPNVYSLAEAYVTPECFPRAICDGETPVGFVMYCFDPDDQAWWIFRLMVDEKRQGQGYGTQGLRLALDELRHTHGAALCYISFEPENEAARALYRKEGFVSDGRMVEGEEVWRIDLTK